MLFNTRQIFHVIFAFALLFVLTTLFSWYNFSGTSYKSQINEAKASNLVKYNLYLPLVLGISNSSVKSDFDKISQDLELMRNLFHGGNGQPATFDSEKAKQLGFSLDSITLAEELVAFTNDLTTMAKETGDMQSASVENMSISPQKYSRLTSYFEEASQRTKNQIEINQQGLNVQTRGYIAEYICGAIWNPLPTRAAPYRIRTNISNPRQTLSSSGYHETPSNAGGGWTRPQNYNPLMCGISTYRDHAYITGKNSLKEQNYNGFTPRGEPNPEVWRSGPWPYTSWPAYVYWWHATY